VADDIYLETVCCCLIHASSFLFGGKKNEAKKTAGGALYIIIVVQSIIVVHTLTPKPDFPLCLLCTFKKRVAILCMASVGGMCLDSDLFDYFEIHD